MHNFDRYSLDSGPDVPGLDLKKQMSIEFDGTLPDDMTMEEFSQMKRK